jgi:2-desacetyl-2-hydroxyethyl bacteriochlorophyllide A dehydrogenase
VKAGVYKGKRQISFEDVPDPTIGDRDFLLKVAACGICGSDLHSYADGWAPPGTVMGHEYSGEVVEVGPLVTRHAVGDRIAVIPLVTCKECENCRAGRINLCEHPKGFGGGYSELVALSDDVISFPVPDGMTLEEAAFLEPLSVAVRAVNRVELELSDPVVVLGLGSIGLSVLQVLKARGMTQVIGVDLSPRRLEMARKLGADVVLNPADGDVVAALKDLLGEAKHRMYSFTRAKAVFECSGARQLVGTAIADIVETAGTVVMVALFEEPISFDANPLVRKEITLIGSYAYTQADYEEAFQLLSDKSVDVTATVTQRAPLSAIDDAFAQQLDKGESVKVLVIPDQ